MSDAIKELVSSVDTNERDVPEKTKTFQLKELIAILTILAPLII